VLLDRNSVAAMGLARIARSKAYVCEKSNTSRTGSSECSGKRLLSDP